MFVELAERQDAVLDESEALDDSGSALLVFRSADGTLLCALLSCRAGDTDK